jgi:hypothetical protein
LLAEKPGTAALLGLLTIQTLCLAALLLQLQMSVKCYAMLPYEELLRPGAAQLALYKKPTDFKSRGQRPSYTSQPMYVHIMRNLTKH